MNGFASSKLLAGLVSLVLAAGRLAAAEYSDKQLTLDINAVVALVSTNYDDAVAHFLLYGTSGLKGNSVISSVIARNELNRVGGEKAIQLPLARLMRRMALNVDAAKDAREYAFSQLNWRASGSKKIKDLLLQTASEISKRDTDDLKKTALRYLERAGGDQKSNR